MKPRLRLMIPGGLAAGLCLLVSLPYVAGLDGDIVSRLLSFDRNRDGALTRNEISDTRLIPIFERYDSNKDASLTREEIIAGAEADSPGSTTAEPVASQPPATFGSEGRPMISRPTGVGGGGAPTPVTKANNPSAAFPDGLSRVGQVVPDDIKEALELSDKQKKQIDDLEKDIASRLDRILNAKQAQLLKDRINQKSNGSKSKTESPDVPAQTTSPVDGDK
jgi:hypothetical protein